MVKLNFYRGNEIFSFNIMRYEITSTVIILALQLGIDRIEIINNNSLV